MIVLEENEIKETIKILPRNLKSFSEMLPYADCISFNGNYDEVKEKLKPISPSKRERGTVSGCYILYTGCGNILYIGTSSNLFARLKIHFNGGDLNTKNYINHVRFALLFYSDDYGGLERFLIRNCRSMFNGPCGPTSVKDSWGYDNFYRQRSERTNFSELLEQWSNLYPPEVKFKTDVKFKPQKRREEEVCMKLNLSDLIGLLDEDNLDKLVLTKLQVFVEEAFQDESDANLVIESLSRVLSKIA